MDTSRRSLWVPSWWRLSLACLFCALLWLTVPRTSSAQIVLKPTLQSIEANLSDLLHNCHLLQGELAKQKLSISSLEQISSGLRAQLVSLEQQLTESQASEALSTQELERSQELLAASQTALNQLSADFDNFKAVRDSDVISLQHDRNTAEAKASIARTWAWIGWAAVAVLGGYAGGHALKLW